MMDEQQIVERLEKIGYKNAQIREALRDVGGVIVAKTAIAYLARLPEEQQAHLRELSESEVQAYLAENQDSLPPMPQEEFEKIHDATWEDYFASVS
jgi:hypothetical protein